MTQKGEPCRDQSLFRRPSFRGNSRLSSVGHVATTPLFLMKKRSGFPLRPSDSVATTSHGHRIHFITRQRFIPGRYAPTVFFRHSCPCVLPVRPCADGTKSLSCGLNGRQVRRLQRHDKGVFSIGIVMPADSSGQKAESGIERPCRHIARAHLKHSPFPS